MRTALVLGGATGIGAAIVVALRRRGDDVFLVDTNADAAAGIIHSDASGRGAFLRLDLASADAASEAVEAALDFSDGNLDTVFYNAGILEAHPLEEWTSEAWDRSLTLNLRTPFFIAQQAAPALAASPVARFIVTSSTGAFRGHARMPAYHASKAGLLGLVRSLADELGPSGITVNAVCPGWINTPFNDDFWRQQNHPADAIAALSQSIPLRRQGVPDDVVGTVLFLASAASAYLTGQALVVDGGYTAV